MYTVCWVDENGLDHWDRYDSKEDIFADESLRPYLAEEDTLVFFPEADNHVMSGDYFCA